MQARLRDVARAVYMLLMEEDEPSGFYAAERRRSAQYRYAVEAAEAVERACVRGERSKRMYI